VSPVVGPYRLHDLLGRGAMGEVWSATHRERGVAAAVKTLLPGQAAHDETFAALRQEVQTIAAIDHPGVVRLFDHGADAQGRPWLAMERLRPLSTLPRTWPELNALLQDALAGLAAAHAAGVLHLDIKPTNLLLSAQRGAVLADFGISHRMSDGDARGVWGSPAYMAPEAFDGDAERLVPQTDLYGLGCLAWALTTGSPPFASVGLEALSQAHRSQDVGPFVPRLPVPVGFESWTRTLLRKRPGERFHSAASALHAVQALPEPPIAQGAVNDVPVGPTLTTWSACPAEPLAQLELVEEPPPHRANYRNTSLQPHPSMDLHVVAAWPVCWASPGSTGLRRRPTCGALWPSPLQVVHSTSASAVARVPVVPDSYDASCTKRTATPGPPHCGLRTQHPSTLPRC